MSDFLVYDQIVMVPLNAIKPYWRNPRDNESTVEALLKIIPKVGFNVPLFIDSDNVIIKGHARYKAAKRLGMDVVPCIVSRKTEEENRLDRIADNKISELAEWDITELRYELEQIDFPLEDIGFDIPKEDFYEKNYQPIEYNGVSDKSFEKAKQDLFGEKIYGRKEEQEDFSGFEQKSSFDTAGAKVGNEKTDNPSDNSRIYVVCPKCGEKFYFNYRYSEKS